MRNNLNELILKGHFESLRNEYSEGSLDESLLSRCVSLLEEYEKVADENTQKEIRSLINDIEEQIGYKPVPVLSKKPMKRAGKRVANQIRKSS